MAKLHAIQLEGQSKPTLLDDNKPQCHKMDGVLPYGGFGDDF